jgi:hypothetical protein
LFVGRAGSGGGLCSTKQKGSCSTSRQGRSIPRQASRTKPRWRSEAPWTYGKIQ